MKGCLGIAAITLATLASACTNDSTKLRIERQPTTLANAKADGWVAGSAVLVGAPGTFTFPQAVSVRISIVPLDFDPEMPAEPAPVSSATVKVFGTGVGEITEAVSCQPTHCEAQVTLTASGQSMLQIAATGADGDESDCFYYAVYEDSDPAAAGETHRASAEADQIACLNDLLD